MQAELPEPDAVDGSKGPAQQLTPLAHEPEGSTQSPDSSAQNIVLPGFSELPRQPDLVALTELPGPSEPRWPFQPSESPELPGLPALLGLHVLPGLSELPRLQVLPGLPEVPGPSELAGPTELVEPPELLELSELPGPPELFGLPEPRSPSQFSEPPELPGPPELESKLSQHKVSVYNLDTNWNYISITSLPAALLANLCA